MPTLLEGEKRRLQNVIKIFLVASIASALFYFAYLFNPDNISNLPLYFLLVAAELYIFVQSFGTWYTLLHLDETGKSPSYWKLKKQILEMNNIDGGVAVLVTVAGEPIDILRPTLEAAVNLKIKHNTYLINDLKDPDDPRTKQYEELAKELGAIYLKTVDNTEQKVGALNQAVSIIKEKYFANFDADFIPNSNFLVKTLPYFHDSKLGWVQTPQAFRNKENLLDKGAGDAVEAFYMFTMPAKNSFNSALFVGTNALFRKEAIQSIGGFKFHHSEDVYTGYCLHQAGWKSLAIPEKLAYGLNPSDTKSLFKQLLRWSGGSLEIFFHNSVFNKKLSLDQKFQYFYTFSFYLFGIVIFIMVLMPILYLIFGIRPLQSLGSEWAFHYIPYFIFQFTTIALFASRLSIHAIIVSQNMFPIYLRGLINALRRKHSKWIVTNTKSEQKFRFFESMNYLYWHYLVVFLSIVAILIGIINVREPLTTLLSLFWVTVNMLITIIFIVGATKADIQSYKA